MINPGLRWWQSPNDAQLLGKVFFVFNPEEYSLENLQKANHLIKYCLSLWYQHGISNNIERRALESMERQYTNNQRRIYHFQRYYSGKINRLSMRIEKLSIIEKR